ncbi:MAG: hypothetical protein ACLRSL_01580 [Streptococcus sp.]
MGQAKLYAEVESPLQAFQQIADVLLPDQKIALEVQCSSLSMERLKNGAMPITSMAIRSIGC